MQSVAPPPAPGNCGTPISESPAARKTWLELRASELEELPGVGPAIAQRIVEHRENNGPFASVDGLLEVSGIGPATLEKIRDRATV